MLLNMSSAEQLRGRATISSVLKDWKNHSDPVMHGAYLVQSGFTRPLINNDGDSLEAWDLVKQAAENHISNLQIERKHIDLFPQLDSFPRLLTFYRRSLDGSEAIATLCFGFKYKESGWDVFHARFMECDIKGKPTLVIMALQRYTNSTMTPVNKPYYFTDSLERINKGERVERILPLKDKYPEDLNRFRKHTRALEKIERQVGVNFPLIAAIVTLAFAKARGNKQVLMTSFDNQYWVRKHQRNKLIAPDYDEFDIPNNYDPTAVALGMRRYKEYGDWWVLKDESDDYLVTIPQATYNNLPPSLKGIAQVAFDGFNSLLQPNTNK